MTAEEYRNYLEQDFSDVDINEMTDLRMIKADRNKSLLGNGRDNFSE